MDIDIREIGKNILKVLALMVLVVGAYTTFYVGLYFALIVGGSIFNIGSENLPISSATNTTLGTVETNWLSTVTTILSSVDFVAALLTLVVVVVVFGVYWNKRKGDKGSNF
jgi:predicted DNA repair protein MutK